MKPNTYLIVARWWNEDIRARFGECGSVHELTPEEVLACAKEFGRIALGKHADNWHRQAKDLDVELLEFQNSYD
jgi:hypothetical protein